MSLKIKNERVHELARQAAAATGKSQTGAIEEALTRLLADYDIDPEQRRLAAKIDRVHTIVRAYVDTLPSREHSVTAVDDLYDEQTGLPR
ncbi:type II toxin-antitoxin system VapB family antitoxin [Janibacter sp. YB324]|uniref:type II toxin-antitoxin system VapB family antitoxin n=1 Tax=Janibacter sp. YB324 TaxID=2761047 RepID=UPI001624F762|nr:type II toxin-antitoxin system VapB family antitoxin [Janibacter sp. YB324]QNF95338.1 type II toxin-antitoxin system VapB family antitoxin [Janibacter sp. YB324]